MAPPRVRHHRGMPSELHVHPDRLRAHAAAAADLSEALRSALPGPEPARDPGIGEEQLRLCSALAHAVRELAELSAALADAAAAAQESDRAAARMLDSARWLP